MKRIDNAIKPIMVLMPAYNEAENLREILPRIPNKICGVSVGLIVLDDGSTDDTIETVKASGYQILSSLRNCGQGAACKLGYEMLIKSKVNIGVTMDADYQHRPEDIEKLVSPILKEKYELVIGSRILGAHEPTNILRIIGIKVFSKIFSMVASKNITDPSSGFKAFKIDKFQSLNLTEKQFHSAEVLIEAIKKELNWKEVPVTINNRKYGKSKKGADWSYGFNFVKTIIKTWRR